MKVATRSGRCPCRKCVCSRTCFLTSTLAVPHTDHNAHTTSHSNFRNGTPKTRTKKTWNVILRCLRRRCAATRRSPLAQCPAWWAVGDRRDLSCEAWKMVPGALSVVFRTVWHFTLVKPALGRVEKCPFDPDSVKLFKLKTSTSCLDWGVGCWRQVLTGKRYSLDKSS